MRDLLTGDAIRLADRIARLAEQLRGIRPYWQARRRGLMAMVKDLKCPHVFVTASAADIQWKDLHRHMPQTVAEDIILPRIFRYLYIFLYTQPHHHNSLGHPVANIR